MKYSYEILFDKQKDIWNWLDANRDNSFSDFNWIDNLSNASDIDIFNKLSTLNDERAIEYISDKLDEKYKNEQQTIDKYFNYIKSEFMNKFEEACSKLEEITGKELFLKNYLFYLTTFPRCPYEENKGEIFFYITLSYDWVDVIENFMHETLHFQFIHYWKNNNLSAVSKLSEDDFDFLKESLAVVLDDSLIPLIEKADLGYESHQALRKKLHKYWQKNKNFDDLVQYGLSIMKPAISCK